MHFVQQPCVSLLHRAAGYPLPPPFFLVQSSPYEVRHPIGKNVFALIIEVYPISPNQMLILK